MENWHSVRAVLDPPACLLLHNVLTGGLHHTHAHAPPPGQQQQQQQHHQQPSNLAPHITTSHNAAAPPPPTVLPSPPPPHFHAVGGSGSGGVGHNNPSHANHLPPPQHGGSHTHMLSNLGRASSYPSTHAGEAGALDQCERGAL